MPVMMRHWALALQALAAQTAVATASTVLRRDVAVIGGGSSGSYMAVRLQQEGKSVALLEKANRLGGHTNTYFDAATNKTFDYGTQILVNTTEVRNFFASLNVPLAPFAPKTSSVAVDFNRGTLGPSWPVVQANESAAALERYKPILASYPNLFRGYNLPDPVPEDLLIPWGDFLKKYNLGPLAYDGWLQFQGSGNLLAQTTLYVLKLFNPMQVQAREQKTKVTEANGNTQALWNAAQAKLGDSVFLSTKELEIERDSSGVTVHATTANGKKTTIHAKKLLITVPPKVELLSQFLDLTSEETQIFSQFNNSYYYNAVIANSGFPNNTSVYNYDKNAAFGLPPLPGVYYFTSEGISDLWAAQYSSPYAQSDEAVRSDILRQANQARKALNLSGPAPRICAWNNHSPFGLTVPPEAIRKGFYKRFVGLQGVTDTFWTGNSWSSGSSSTIWDFSENELLPKILDALGDDE